MFKNLPKQSIIVIVINTILLFIIISYDMYYGYIYNQVPIKKRIKIISKHIIKCGIYLALITVFIVYFTNCLINGTSKVGHVCNVFSWVQVVLWVIFIALVVSEVNTENILHKLGYTKIS